MSGRGKERWKFRFLGYFFKAKTEECNQNNWSFFDKFRMFMVGSDTYFLEVSAHVSLKVATKDYLRGPKKSKNLALLSLSSKTKRLECDQKDWSVFDQFGISMPCSVIYFLKVDARVSLKVATKGSFRNKNYGNLDF